MHIVISRLDNHFSLLHLFNHMRMGHYSVHLHQRMMADGFIQAFGLTHIVKVTIRTVLRKNTAQ